VPIPARSPDRVLRSGLALLLCLALPACISPAPRLAAGGIGTVAARATAGLSDQEARRTVLAQAARITVDHGYRYFILLPAANQPAARRGAAIAIHAGQPQRFQIVRRAPAGAVPWDAYRLLTQRPESR
jgi:hypothetical protein